MASMAADWVEPFFALQVGDFACFCLCEPSRPRGVQDVEFKAGPSKSPAPRPQRSRRSKEEVLDSGTDQPAAGSRPPLPSVPASLSPRGAAALPLGTWAPEESPGKEHPLRRAVRLGKFLEARRHIKSLEAAGGDPLELLGAETLERVQRVLQKYDHSQHILAVSVFDLPVYEVNEAMQLQWGLEIAGNKLRFVYEIQEHHDILRGFVGVQERDLHKAFNRSLISAEMLGQHHPNDGIWRSITLSSTTGVKGDNITIVSSLDALDEPNGNIWGCTYSPPEGAEEVGGVPIPPPLEGHSRMPYSFWVSTLTPLARQPDGKSEGYRMKVAVELELPYVASKIVEVMPRFLLRRLARSKMEQSPKDFRKFASSSPVLDKRMQSSPRAEFYEYLRRHLDEIQ